MARSLRHHLHSHDLTKASFPTDFTCKACKTAGGNGMRYRCLQGCDFDLHEYCATCPRKLKSFMHPKHALKLHAPRHSCFPWRTPTTPSSSSSIYCDLCGEEIDAEEGSFYKCAACGFNVHLLCTQLPQHINHRRHRSADHQLRLRPSDDHRSCCVCKVECSGWRYSCEQCGIDIHIKCITSDGGGSRWSISQILSILAEIVAVALPVAAPIISAAAGLN